jgi:hypothetical protein
MATSARRAPIIGIAFVLACDAVPNAPAVERTQLAARPALRAESDAPPLNEALVSSESDRVLADRVHGAHAVLADGKIVVARLGEEPGESDLWIVTKDGAPRTLCVAPGPDEQPFALSDGRVLFVSARTSVASLWVADVATGECAQLTNRGMRAGGPRDGFVPPPEGEVREDRNSIVYDAGGGSLWRVDLSTGTGREVK